MEDFGKSAFDEWLEKVEESLSRKTGGAVGIDDLPDWGYRDAFDDGMRPKDVAAEVLEENGFESNFLNMWHESADRDTVRDTDLS